MRQLLSLLGSRPVAVVAAGILAQYAAGGLFDATFGLHLAERFGAYKEHVLEARGSRDAADMVASFLGRPFSFDAYEAWLKG